jgi:hypothetical protein
MTTRKVLNRVLFYRAKSHNRLPAKALAAACCMATLCSSALAQDAVTNEIGYQGFSGLFNVPTGDAINYGEFHFSYSTLSDIRGRGNYFQGNNFNLSVSPFPGLEVTMRNSGYTESVKDGSDLAASFKYSPTFIPDNWFDVSFGALDLGGETGTQRAWFASVSREFGPFRLTVGKGDQLQENSARRWVDGFYGIEYQPFEWATLVAENDGANTNYGVKLRTPKRWLDGSTQLYASWMFGTDIEDVPGLDEQHYFGVGIRASMFSSFDAGLDRPRNLEQRIADNFEWLIADYEDTYVPVDKGLSSLVEDDDVVVDQLGRLKHALAVQGFENVWVGRRNERLYIRFENSVFNRNDIDALGVAMGLAASFTPDELAVLDVSLSKYDVPILHYETDLKLLKAFYNNEAALPILTPLKATRDQVGDMFWVGGSKSPYFVPRVSISPKVTTFIGTELGMLDYSAAITASFTLPIWPGLTAHADYDHNVYDSPDYQPGRTFWRYRVPTRWSNWAVKQTIKLPFDVYGSVGVSGVKDTYLQEYEGVVAEGLWQSPQGVHQFSFSGGAYENIYYPTLKREVAIGRYRYYWEMLDVSISVEAGQYFRQDKGGKVEVKFNFGDTQMRFFAVDTDYQAIGLGWTVPIGLRRDMRPRLFQIKGADHWRYGLSTVVNNADGRNPLGPGRVRTPAYVDELRNTFFNGDRLSVAYIQGNATRLKDAYFTLVRQ